MTDILILTHVDYCAPGHLATVLEQHGLDFTVLRTDLNQLDGYDLDRPRAVAVMGGPMSVNDDLPWIRAEIDALRHFIRRDIPVIGHCLGGQLISKALGGAVTKNPGKEIGWGEAWAEDGGIARYWLGELAGRAGTVFQWHGETFSIPPGATRLFASAHCANQMFVRGPHLGMQCHVEMTPEMIATWCGQWAGEAAAAADHPGVQQPPEMLAGIAARLPAMRRLSDQLYSVWIQGLRRDQ